MIKLVSPKVFPIGKGIVREVYLNDEHVGNIHRDNAFNYYYQTLDRNFRGPISTTLEHVQLSIGGHVG